MRLLATPNQHYIYQLFCKHSIAYRDLSAAKLWPYADVVIDNHSGKPWTGGAASMICES